MAEEVQIAGTGEVGKIRNPLGVIGLTLITLGIYGIVWYYKLNKELAAVGRSKNSNECGDNPMTSVLAVTIGAFVIVPAFLSLWNTWKRLGAAQRLTGATPSISAALGFVLMIFLGPVGTYFMQKDMNEVLTRS